MTRVDCEECGGPVKVAGARLTSHGIWVKKRFGIVETDQPCPGSGADVDPHDMPPSSAALLLLEAVRDGRLGVSPAGVVRYTNGQYLARRVLGECTESGWLGIDGKTVMVTAAGRHWLTRLT